MSQHPNESDGVHEGLNDGLKTALAIAARLGQEMARLRELVLRDAAQRDAAYAQHMRERFEAERSVARARLARLDDPRWWRSATDQDIAQIYELAESWAPADSSAASKVTQLGEEILRREERRRSDLESSIEDTTVAGEARRLAQATLNPDLAAELKDLHELARDLHGTDFTQEALAAALADADKNNRWPSAKRTDDISTEAVNDAVTRLESLANSATSAAAPNAATPDPAPGPKRAADERIRDAVAHLHDRAEAAGERDKSTAGPSDPSRSPQQGAAATEWTPPDAGYDSPSRRQVMRQALTGAGLPSDLVNTRMVADQAQGAPAGKAAKARHRAPKARRSTSPDTSRDRSRGR